MTDTATETLPMKKTSKRTDAHRVGAIIPANYQYIMSYNLSTSQDGWPIPSFGVNCELDRRTEVEVDGKKVFKNGEHDADGHCCVIGLLHKAKVKFAKHGTTGKCTVCGAAFVYGDVWKHDLTGEYIHLGHTCAEKYELLADRSEYELSLGRLKAAAAAQVQKQLNLEARLKFLADHPGLEEALKTNHPIVIDIGEKFTRFCDLSEKQVTLVMKIATEANLPPEQKEKQVPAPIPASGRVTFKGVVVSAKTVESVFGSAYKMTVKVTTPDGVWLAWGTIPAALLDSVPNTGNRGRIQNLKGATVEITAGLKPGREAHFAQTVRPVGVVVSLSADLQAEIEKEKAAEEAWKAEQNQKAVDLAVRAAWDRVWGETQDATKAAQAAEEAKQQALAALAK